MANPDDRDASDPQPDLAWVLHQLEVWQPRHEDDDAAAWLVDLARRQRTQLSIRAAATQAGLSDTRWRQITASSMKVGHQQVPVRAPAATLARMALVAKLSAEELAAAGRHDAAAELTRMNRESAIPVGAGIDPELLAGLDPNDVRRVEDFIRGIKAGR